MLVRDIFEINSDVIVRCNTINNGNLIWSTEEISHYFNCRVIGIEIDESTNNIVVEFIE